MRPEAAQRRRSIALVRRALGLEVVDADLLRGVQVPARLRVERRHVARGAARLSRRRAPAPRSAAAASKLAARRLGARQRELIEMERRQLRRDQIARRCARCRSRSRAAIGELCRVVEARIVERALPVHLEVGHERVPVRDGAPAGPRVQVDAGQTERGRNQRRGGLPVGSKRLAVEQQLGVEFSRAPSCEHRAHGRFVDAEQRRERRTDRARAR